MIVLEDVDSAQVAVDLEKALNSISPPPPPPPPIVSGLTPVALPPPLQLDESVLLDAIKEGDINKVESLLKRGAQVDLQDKDGVSPLMGASHYKRGDIIRLLLDWKAKVNLQDKNGDSALIIASKVGFCMAAKLFLDNSAKVDLQDNDGWSALMHGIKHMHGDITKLLLDRDADVDLQTPKWESPLSLAAKTHSTLAFIQDKVRVRIISDSYIISEHRNVFMEEFNVLRVTY